MAEPEHEVAVIPLGGTMPHREMRNGGKFVQ